MKVAEAPPDQERSHLIQAVAQDAAELLEVDLNTDDSAMIVGKVYDAVVDLVFERPSPIGDDDNPHLLLGALWGSQMARQFDWYWADVVLDDSIKEVAMIAPRQEMIIFPFSFTAACIHRQCVCTIALAFNMLLDGERIGPFPPQSYENIMLSIHHIIPPYSLEPAE